MKLEERVTRTEEEIKALRNAFEERNRKLNGSLDRIWKAIEDLRCDIEEIRERLANRLPTWATVLISVLTSLLGFAVAIIGALSRKVF